MPIINKAEILRSVSVLIGDNNSDDTISFYENLSDTLDDLESKATSTVDWESKYKENDEAWREKYKNRFLEGSDEKGEVPPPREDNPKPKKLTFEDLFK